MDDDNVPEQPSGLERKLRFGIGALIMGASLATGVYVMTRPSATPSQPRVRMLSDLSYAERRHLLAMNEFQALHYERFKPESLSQGIHVIRFMDYKYINNLSPEDFAFVDGKLLYGNKADFGMLYCTIIPEDEDAIKSLVQGGVLDGKPSHQTTVIVIDGKEVRRNAPSGKTVGEFLREYFFERKARP